MKRTVAKMLDINPEEIHEIKITVDDDSNEKLFQIAYGGTITEIKESDLSEYIETFLK